MRITEALKNEIEAAALTVVMEHADAYGTVKLTTITHGTRQTLIKLGKATGDEVFESRVRTALESLEGKGLVLRSKTGRRYYWELITDEMRADTKRRQAAQHRQTAFAVRLTNMGIGANTRCHSGQVRVSINDLEHYLNRIAKLIKE